MVKEQEGGEECVPFRMLNSACGSVLFLFSCPPIKYQLSYCKGKISTCAGSVWFGLSHSDSLSYIQSLFKAIHRVFFIVALKLESWESET